MELLSEKTNAYISEKSPILYKYENNSKFILLPQNQTNDIVLASDETSLFYKCIVVVMYVMAILVALLGNGCVIYVVLSIRQMRNVTNYFIASLATSDALMAFVCIPVTFISNVLTSSWPFPSWMCPFVTYFQVCKNKTLLF